MSKFDIRLTINDRPHRAGVEPRLSLLDFLRDHIGLGGTHMGCEHGVCGACTVHLDGRAIRSCVTPLASVAGRDVHTIESLSPDRSHPLQKAWMAENVPQCGYCQSGMIMAASALLASNPNPSDAEIDSNITNVCRCGSYPRVRKAIRSLATA